MATAVNLGPFVYTFGGQGLAPGQARWVSYVSSTFSKALTVALTPYPGTIVAGEGVVHATNTLSIGEIFVSNEPIFASGGIVVGATLYVGANIKNAGQKPIRYATVHITAILP